jgi:hypothetical protein
VCETHGGTAVNTEHKSAAKYAIGTRKNTMMFHVTITPNVLWSSE